MNTGTKGRDLSQPFLQDKGWQGDKHLTKLSTNKQTSGRWLTCQQTTRDVTLLTNLPPCGVLRTSIFLHIHGSLWFFWPQPFFRCTISLHRAPAELGHPAKYRSRVATQTPASSSNHPWTAGTRNNHRVEVYKGSGGQLIKLFLISHWCETMTYIYIYPCLQHVLGAINLTAFGPLGLQRTQMFRQKGPTLLQVGHTTTVDVLDVLWYWVAPPESKRLQRWPPHGSAVKLTTTNSSGCLDAPLVDFEGILKVFPILRGPRDGRATLETRCSRGRVFTQPLRRGRCS